MSSTHTVTTLACLTLLALTGARTVGAQDASVFECGTVFSPDTTPASLAAVFGEANVVSAELHIGEGRFETGTVIFNDTEDRIEVTWRPRIPRSPDTVRIRGERSSWETPHGLALGLDLRSIEAINGGPFQLHGFGWDNGGTVRSWEGGRLEEWLGSPCRVRARLSPDFSRDDPEFVRAADQVLGEARFSSEHPAMQLLNPTIFELFLIIP